MPIVSVCPPGVSTSLDTNGIRRSSKRIAPPRRIVRHRHRRPLRIDANAAGKDAGVGDEHVGRFVDAAIEVDEAVPRVLVDRLVAVQSGRASCREWMWQYV